MRGHVLAVRFVILLATLLAGSFTFAQESGRARFQVSGRVTERGSGEPVVMASVVIQDLGLWAVTDAEGRFALAEVAPGRHQLVVSLLGYETRTLPIDVKGNIARLAVELSVSSLTLDAVVVTAKDGGEMTTSSKSSKQSLIQLARDLTSLSLKKKIIERI